MNKAYIILGVSDNDSEDVIKKAYRTKAYEIENSDLSDDKKQQKMAELDSAFDYVFNEKRGTSYSSSHCSHSYSTQFPDVRQQISDGRIDDAEMILNGIPENMRSAEWYYLKGLIHRSRGWLNEAYSCFQTAVSMDPENTEYKDAYESFSKKANGGYRVNYGNSSNKPNACGGLCCGDSCLDDLCAFLCCDSICECFGGDLCGCC